MNTTTFFVVNKKNASGKTDKWAPWDPSNLWTQFVSLCVCHKRISFHLSASYLSASCCAVCSRWDENRRGQSACSHLVRRLASKWTLVVVDEIGLDLAGVLRMRQKKLWTPSRWTRTTHRFFKSVWEIATVYLSQQESLIIFISEKIPVESVYRARRGRIRGGKFLATLWSAKPRVMWWGVCLLSLERPKWIDDPESGFSIK